MNPLRYLLQFALIQISGIVAFGDDLAQLPVNARQLQTAYRKSAETAVAPIRDRYVVELKKLRDQAARDGKLEEALAIKREIEQEEGSAGLASEKLRPTQPFIGQWTSPFGVIEILADGTAHRGEDTARWEIVGGEVVASWANGFKHRYTIPQGGDTMRGREVPPKGNSKPIVLTRIK